MKLPLSWLREWVPWVAEPQAIARQLTMLGFEVEAIEPAAPPFTQVVVALIESMAPHPQADKLRICQVRDGGGALLQIVCGAANARVGLHTALARIGAELPGGATIKAANLRGVESAGMLCSATELGLPAENDGIVELPADAPVGTDLRGYLDLDDHSLEISITPNRGDAMSVLGIARELAAAAGSAAIAAHPAVVRATIQDTHPVRLDEGAGCGRLASRVIRAVDNTRATPPWMRERLRRAGHRSISPVVDVTNYVLLEFGQPMHAYDLAKVQGVIHARRARAGEPVRLLTGQDLQLAPDVLAIADDAGVVGIGGIMGGERTAISAQTRDLLFEVAWFDPAVIAGRARRFGLFTDAGQRFERGVDPALQERALERATQLLLDIAGGQAGPTQLQQLPAELPTAAAVSLRPARLAQLLGIQVETARIETLLICLGLQVRRDGERLLVTPPSWRFDLHLEVDLIEEVARSVGLESIPEVAAAQQHHLRGAPESVVSTGAVLQLLAARGFQEIVSFGFVDPALQRALLGDQPRLRLRNPIASDLAEMRASLWPGLVRAALENTRRQQERCRLFEIATVFKVPTAGEGRESLSLGGIVLGSRLPEQWAASGEPADFFDAKGDVSALLALAGPDAAVQFVPATGPPPALHPGRCAEIHRDGARIGILGQLHPQLVQSLQFAAAPLLFEFDYGAITTARPAQYVAQSAYPWIRRDLSFTVPVAETFSRIVEHVSVASSNQLKELRIFDVYTGDGVEKGRKSIALGLILQDLSRTLTDTDADRIVAAVVSRLQSEVDARLRE